MSTKAINLNKRGEIKWNTTIFMIIFHAGALASLFMLSWKVVPITLLLCGSLGAWVLGWASIGF